MNKDQLLYFVTGNEHKFSEVSELFQQKKINYDLIQLDINPIEIQADTLSEVASFKLKSIQNQVNGSFFVEDAGFFVDTPLNGFPGVYSSYVFKTIGNEGILRLIKDFGTSKAHFVSYFALYYTPSKKMFLFEGRVDGKVSSSIKGTQGFGYDPIFIPDENPAKTFAELSKKEKNEISHRGKALDKLIKFLKTH
ncbi:MAG: dITP/XTP pyrophosphatase [Promethearchaeota archaeon]|nr:MAG: dITP/XTP pyrophosphatase [Candidatus Lokiarchaeota archaeon]